MVVAQAHHFKVHTVYCITASLDHCISLVAQAHRTVQPAPLAVWQSAKPLTSTQHRAPSCWRTGTSVYYVGEPKGVIHLPHTHHFSDLVPLTPRVSRHDTTQESAGPRGLAEAAQSVRSPDPLATMVVGRIIMAARHLQRIC